ncbi:MAG: RsmB/NOP family class I SAM-dependent RNA methyltransferase [Parvularculaceae bacterium]|nr:RsmB/NOP family class I SAM-dependent RNA methyltransferase [Parvularculaceae bacterium]
MRDAGKIAAAIEVLADFDARRVPLKTALADWARNNRYAGAKDRAWISGLCLDVLRRRHSLAAKMGADSPRALAFAALRFMWGMSADDLADAAAGEYGPGALSAEERQALQFDAGTDVSSSPCGAESALAENAAREMARAHIAGDFPEWLTLQIERVFGDSAARVMAAFAARADIDLRINTLKATPEKALAALKSVKAEAAPQLTTAARIAAPYPSMKAPGVTDIPAFNKGWVEVQDLGSQIAALAAGDIKGAQVLDFCAGGGGKTLALAALMENTGQLYAYDRDARRLRPLYDRAKRAGVRNLQIINPATDKCALDALAGRMDVVFVDAPCTGAGTWRRHPDTKWRLTPEQLERRMGEQDAVLAEAAEYVKPGGVLVYVTCSFLMEENEDRLSQFVAAHADFSPAPVLARFDATGLLTDAGRAALAECAAANDALRLTPLHLRADGFFVAALQRESA